MTATTPDDRDPRALDDWVSALAVELDLDPEQIDVAAILHLAKVAAHSIARPAAPLTTFMAGLAAGRAGATPDDVRSAIRAAEALAAAARS